MVFGPAGALEYGIPTVVVAATRRSGTCVALQSPTPPDRRLL
jgi:hypothetical protein